MFNCRLVAISKIQRVRPKPNARPKAPLRSPWWIIKCKMIRWPATNQRYGIQLRTWPNYRQIKTIKHCITDEILSRYICIIHYNNPILISFQGSVVGLRFKFPHHWTTFKLDREIQIYQNTDSARSIDASHQFHGGGQCNLPQCNMSITGGFQMYSPRAFLTVTQRYCIGAVVLYSAGAEIYLFLIVFLSSCTLPTQFWPHHFVCNRLCSYAGPD